MPLLGLDWIHPSNSNCCKASFNGVRLIPRLSLRERSFNLEPGATSCWIMPFLISSYAWSLNDFGCSTFRKSIYDHPLFYWCPHSRVKYGMWYTRCHDKYYSNLFTLLQKDLVHFVWQGYQGFGFINLY